MLVTLPKGGERMVKPKLTETALPLKWECPSTKPGTMDLPFKSMSLSLQDSLSRKERPSFVTLDIIPFLTATAPAMGTVSLTVMIFPLW